MKKILFAMISVLLVSNAAFCDDDSAFTVMTYNVRHCAGMDLKLNIEKTAAVIKKENPRFVALQEIDSKTRRSQGVDQAAKLGELTGLFPSYAPTINFDGGKYGIAILSKEKPIKCEQHPLPPDKGERRTIVIAEFNDVYFACTHWVHNNKEMRYESMKIIEKIMESKKDKPLILCGDLNATPNDKEIVQLKKSFVVLSPEKIRSYHGSPICGPSGTVDDFCIDYISIDKTNAEKYTVVSSFVVNDSKTSDHKPIVVTLKKK